MLLQFSVENFFSFKDKQVFTALASKDTTHAGNLIQYRGKNYSAINVFYGANASGKTNFVKAFDYIKWLVASSNNRLETSGTSSVPFAFSESTKVTPSVFELIFIKNDVKYAYSFSCDKTAIVSERLDVYEKSQRKLIFDRKNVDEYTFNSYKKELEPIKDKNTKNKLFLCTAANWNFNEAKPVVDFILEDLRLGLNYDSGHVASDFGTLSKSKDYEDYKRFCLNLLGVADISISDFAIQSEERDVPPDLLPLIKANRSGNFDPATEKVTVTKIDTFHTITEDSAKKQYALSLMDESNGTRAIFYMAPVLYDVFKHGRVLIVDEIDRSLHPLLVRYLVGLFGNKSANKYGAQLICTTHDTNLLDLELLRRDEIWFTERNSETGATEIYSLTEFSPRKGENIENGYLAGRYGAIPFINSTVKLWQE